MNYIQHSHTLIYFSCWKVLIKILLLANIPLGAPTHTHTRTYVQAHTSVHAPWCFLSLMVILVKSWNNKPSKTSNRSPVPRFWDPRIPWCQAACQHTWHCPVRGNIHKSTGQLQAGALLGRIKLAFDVQRSPCKFSHKEGTCQLISITVLFFILGKEEGPRITGPGLGSFKCH